MRYSIVLFIALFIFSCGKEKIIQLPEITHSDITEINDVSVAYMFYDETTKDSVELNRGNLIISTNWLVNVDKRLTLKQAIPSIKFLQDKKNTSSHKNENAKNYFTCSDISRKNLGFIEFTNTAFVITKKNDTISIPLEYEVTTKFIFFNTNDEVFIINPYKEPFINTSSKNQLIADLKKVYTSESNVSLRFSKSLSFQDYITIKSILSESDLKNLKISNYEFIQD